MQIASPVARDPASSNTDALRVPNAQWASTLVAGVGPPDHGVYGKSPAQAGPAVADDLPSGMGGEASCAPIPPTGPAPTRVVQVPHRGSRSSTKANLSRKAPIPPNPLPSALLASPAPVPDRDAQPPPDPNSEPHTKVSVADFRPPKTDASAALPYGARYQSPDDQRPIETPGFTVTIPLRLP